VIKETGALEAAPRRGERGAPDPRRVMARAWADLEVRLELSERSPFP